MSGDLEDLGRKLDQIKQRETEAGQKLLQKQTSADSMSLGIRAGTELVGAIIAGGFIGWLLDGWLGTKPAFLIIMLILGVITGFMNVWKTTQNIGVGVGFSELHKVKKDAKTLPNDKTE